MRGEWRTQWWFHSHSGTFYASASRASIVVLVTLGTAADEPLTMRAASCKSYIASFNMHMHCSVWYHHQILSGVVEKRLRDELERQLCDAAQNTINVNAIRELRTFPVSFLLGAEKQWLLDLRTVSPPVLAPEYLETFHKGEFFRSTDVTEAPFQPSSPLPSPPAASHMVTFLISNYVFDTAGYVWHRSGMSLYRLTRNDLPEHHRDRLNTTCGIQDGCLGVLIHEVAENYPNSFIEVHVSTMEPPSVIINTQDITVRLVGSLAFRARLQDEHLAHLFDVKVVLNVSVVPHIHQQVLKGRVSSIDNTMILTYSSVGEFRLEILKFFLDVIKEKFVIPKVNEVGKCGLPIPKSKHMRFVHPQLQLEKNCVRISAYVSEELTY